MLLASHMLVDDRSVGHRLVEAGRVEVGSLAGSTDSQTMARPGRSFLRAYASNQSCTQLKRSPTSGQRNSSMAFVC